MKLQPGVFNFFIFQSFFANRASKLLLSCNMVSRSGFSTQCHSFPALPFGQSHLDGDLPVKMKRLMIALVSFFHHAGLMNLYARFLIFFFIRQSGLPAWKAEIEKYTRHIIMDLYDCHTYTYTLCGEAKIYCGPHLLKNLNRLTYRPSPFNQVRQFSLQYELSPSKIKSLIHVH